MNWRLMFELKANYRSPFQIDFPIVISISSDLIGLELTARANAILQ